MANVFDIFRRLEQQRASEPVLPVSHLVVGLGNTGREYVHTRHNTGFLCLDEVCRHWNTATDRAKFRSLVGEAVIAGARCLLMRPQTLMNASGLAVAEAARFYHIDPSHIIVISDDINLPVGAMRVRAHGSDGGQRGIRSIIAELGTDQFPRLRIGVGSKPHPDYDLAAWVLSDFSPSELSLLSDLFPVACLGIECLVSGDVNKETEKRGSVGGFLKEAPKPPRTFPNILLSGAAVCTRFRTFRVVSGGGGAFFAAVLPCL